MSRFMQDIDLGDVPELQAVPDGTLVVEVESWEKKMSSNNNPMASLCTKIIAPEEVAKKVGRYYLRIPLMESTLFRWRQLYEACGCLELATAGFDPDDLIGKEFGMIITLVEYQGSPRNREQKFLVAAKARPELRGKWKDVEDIETGGGSGSGTGGGGGGAAGVFG